MLYNFVQISSYSYTYFIITNDLAYPDQRATSFCKSSLSCSTVMSSLDQLVVDFKEMIRVREENHRLIEDLLVQRLRDEADLVTLALCTQEQSLLGE